MNDSDRYDAAEAEVTRCWNMYKTHVQHEDLKKREDFQQCLREKLPDGVEVFNWPETWPEVLFCFGAVGDEGYEASERFVRAVQWFEF